jgi:hypothetical protein
MKVKLIGSALASGLLLFLTSGCGPQSVITHHNDNVRTGAYTSEGTLTTANVNVSRFGRIATIHVVGDIYAQPLYVRRARITGFGVRDVLIVATAHNNVYAFDANDRGDVTRALWQREFGGAVPMPNPDFANSTDSCQTYLRNHGGTLPPEDERVNATNHANYNLREIGITGTPVIDEQAATIYLVSFQRDNRTHAGACMDLRSCQLKTPCDVHAYHYQLHALNLASGVDRPGSPVEITASAPATSAGSVEGKYVFDPTLELQRAALLLAPRPGGGGNILYIGFGGYGDIGLYHGWLLAYVAQSLTRAAVFLDTPEKDASYPRNPKPFDGGEQGGIWQSGSGPAADFAGNIYFMTGNGSNTSRNLGDSFVKLTLSSGSFLTTGAWSPTPNEMDDADLGSSGPLVVSDTLIVGGGKPGNLFLLDKNLALQFKFNAAWAGATSPDCRDRVRGNSHIHGSPVYWDGPMGPTLFVWGEQDYLKAYRLTGRSVATDTACSGDPPYGSPVGRSRVKAVENSMPGGILSLSSSGKSAGTGIVWASRPFSGTAVWEVPPGILEAFDASNPQGPETEMKELWNSEAQADRDRLGNFARFTPPTVAQGHVYMATFSNAVAVYGLLDFGRGGSVNACGGSTPLPVFAQPGMWCQDRGTNTCGTWRCIGTEAITCDTSRGAPQDNGCGGCAPLPIPGSGFGRGDKCQYNDTQEGILVCAVGGNRLVCCPTGAVGPGCGPGAP